MNDRLFRVFDEGLRVGFDNLTPYDRELFLIQDFIIDYEMGGLSGYFYNRLPTLNRVLLAINAMERRGLVELAALVSEATSLFRGYSDLAPQATWSEVLRKVDPDDRLTVLHRRIGVLDNYGLAGASIR